MADEIPNPTRDREWDEAHKTIEDIVEGVYSNPSFVTQMDAGELASLGVYSEGDGYPDGNYGRIIWFDWARHEEGLLDDIQNDRSELPEDRTQQIESISDLTSDELKALKEEYKGSIDSTAYDHHLLYRITDSKGRCVWYSLEQGGDIGYVEYEFDGEFYTSEERFLKSFKDRVDAGKELSEWEV